MPKIRLDVYMTENGLAPSREKAKAYIMSGIVYVNNEKTDKAGTMINPDDAVEVRGKKLAYVSRGGLKLEKAISEFNIDLKNKVCMDIGASTGGFTDCMLQNGAARVYSIDVGYGQLAWKLRCDPRVVNLERTNVRYITEAEVPEKVGFASVDVSFISLELILPVAADFTESGAHIMCLIKPQFEAGRENVGKKGVVRDKSVHVQVIEKIYNFCIKHGLYPEKLSFSPVKGPEGNIEYLIYISKSETEVFPHSLIAETVEKSHDALDK